MGLRPCTLAMLLAASIPAAAQEPTWVIPPGNEGVVARITGIGEPSVGGCTVGQVAIEPTAVFARYGCDGREVAVRLVHPGVGAAEPLLVRSDEAPAALLDALRARVREHGAAFAWRRAAADVPDPATPAAEPFDPTAHPLARVGASPRVFAVGVLGVAAVCALGWLARRRMARAR